MLEWIWFSLLALAGFGCAIRATVLGRDPETGFGEMGFALASLGLMGLSLAASSDLTVIPLYSWLRDALPQQGTQINQTTAIALTAIAGAVFVFGLPFAVAMTAFRHQDVSEASRIARHAIGRARANRE